MTNTPNLSLLHLAAAQAQKHVTVNEALSRLDGLVQLSVKDRNLTAPPASPVDGDRYIVAAGGTGAWAGWDGDVVLFTGGAWVRMIPQAGWLVWVEDEGVLGATSYDCGISGQPSKFGGALGVAAGSTNVGVIGPQAFYAPTSIVLTANGANFAGGDVRIAIHYLLPTAPA